MIDWVHDMCRQWGRQKRRLIGEPALLQNPVVLCSLETQALLVRGEPPAGRVGGMSGRLIEEGATGAAIRSVMDRTPPPALTGNALQVSIAIQKAILMRELTEKMFEALFAFYVFKGPLKVKIDVCGVDRSSLYKRIDRAHIILSCYLSGDTVATDEVAVA